MSHFQAESSDPTLLALALSKPGMPLVLFDVGASNWAIVAGGHVFRPKDRAEAFFLYFAVYSVYHIDIYSSVQVCFFLP